MMQTVLRRIAAVFLSVLTFLLSSVLLVDAIPATQFAPPTNVTVHMYRLRGDGSLPPPGERVLCSSGDTHFGCTAFVGDNNHPYPYGSTNPVMVSIETDYLLDVVPQELPPDIYHRTALEAQAIAARTYAYFHIQHGHTFDNSTNKQVFIPYKFESLPPTTFPDNASDPCASSNLNAQQQTICNALTHRYYVSYSGDSPAHTMFFADALNHTRTYTNSAYLVQVEDPISSACDAGDSGHGHGLSQKGASRWARGNQCSRTDSQPGAPWSVRWDCPEQILAHYYTGIHVRDASASRLTPAYRWLPLSVDWHTPDNHLPVMYYTQTYTVTFWLQNAGTTTWPSTEQVYLSYHGWEAGGVQAQGVGIAQVVAPGETIAETLTLHPSASAPPGTPHRLRFDMLLDPGGWFSELEPGRAWPTYDVTVCVNGPCRVFLPLAMKNWVAGCEPHIGYWYPVGTNTCEPTVSNCAQGDGQPDGVWAGPWEIGYHQVEFTPQYVLDTTEIGTYWQTHSGAYGNLYMDAELNGVWQTVGTSLSQSQGAPGRWESTDIGAYAGQWLTGLRFGFSSSTAGHQFKVDGYRLGDFLYCGE
jgi:hypothetical protein